MAHASKISSLALYFGLILTILIVVLKGGSPQWASLLWVSLCGISLSILILMRWITPQNNQTDDTSIQNATKNATKGNLAFYKSFLQSPLTVLVIFQFWVLLQALLISKDQSASIEQSLVGMGMLLYIGIWLFAVQHHGERVFFYLYSTIIGMAVCHAAYGFWVQLSGSNTLLWMPKLYYLDRPTGFFVNANHFAAFLVLSLILCLSHSVSHSNTNKSKHTFITAIDSVFSPKFIVSLILSIALVASLSLGGMSSFALALACLVYQALKNSKNRTKWFLLTFIFISAILVIALFSDYSIVERQIADAIHTITRRIELTHAALGMLKENWLLGVGSGAFYSQFSIYRTLEIGNVYYNYAHNDLLQLWIELGLIGTLLLLWFLAKVLHDNMAVLKNNQQGMPATFAYASLYSTLAVVVHSLVDFPLHLPGFSVCYLITISLNSILRCSRLL